MKQQKHCINVWNTSDNLKGCSTINNFQRLSEENINYQYYEQFRKLYNTGHCLSEQMKILRQKKEELICKLNKIEKKNTEEQQQQTKTIENTNSKRHRRSADEIERNFICTAARCGRDYGSQGSLQQHIKMKHPSMYRQLS